MQPKACSPGIRGPKPAAPESAAPKSAAPESAAPKSAAQTPAASLFWAAHGSAHRVPVIGMRCQNAPSVYRKHVLHLSKSTPSVYKIRALLPRYSHCTKSRSAVFVLSHTKIFGQDLSFASPPGSLCQSLSVFCRLFGLFGLFDLQISLQKSANSTCIPALNRV